MRRLFSPNLYIALFPAVILGIILGFTPLEETSYWWNLSIGRLIAYWHAVPEINHFIYTADNQPLSPANQPWLYQWLLFHIHHIGGVEFAIVIRNTIVIATWTILGLYLNHLLHNHSKPLLLATSVLLTLGFVAIAHISVSSTVFVLPLFAVALILCHRTALRKCHPWRLFVVFPIVSFLWVNITGNFWIPTGLALFCFIFVIFLHRCSANKLSYRTTLYWLFALAFSAFAVLANPYGHTVYSGPWISPNDHYILLVIVALTIVFITLIARMNHSQPAISTHSSRPRTLAIIVLFFACLSLAFIVQPASSWQKQLHQSFHQSNQRVDAPYQYVVPETLPLECAMAIEQFGSRPRLFSPPAYAGILAYHVQREKPWPMLFSGPSLNDSPPAIRKLYPEMLNPNVALGVFVQYNIDLVVVDTRNYQQLIDRLYDERKWRVIYQNEHHACFLKVD